MFRTIVNYQIENLEYCDYPDFTDAYILYAEWADTEEALTSDELELLNDSCYRLDLIYSYLF